MSNNNNIDKIVSIFDDYLDTAELLEAEMQAKISTAILKKRLKLGLSQKEFAAYLGVSQGLISRWEGGDHNFTIKTIAEVFDKLGIEVNILIGNELERREFTGFWKDDTNYRDDTIVNYYIEYDLEKEYKSNNWRKIVTKNSGKINKFTNAHSN